MNILQSIQRIIQRPKFFTSLEFVQGRTIRFYSLLILIFTLVSVAISLPGAFRFVEIITSQDWQNQTSIIIELYPDELEIRFTEGIISTNAEEPFAIAFPESWRTHEEGARMPENILVIDTMKSIALEDFATKKTMLILGKSTLGFWDEEESSVSIYDLESKAESESFVLTKTEYAQFIAQASSVFQKVLLIGILFLPVFLYIAYWVSYLVYLLFGACIVWIAAKIRGYKLSYKNAYKAGLYLLPIPLVYDFFVVLLSDFPHVRVPFLFTAFLFAMTLRNFPKENTLGVVAPVEIETASTEAVREAEVTIHDSPVEVETKEKK